MRHCKDVYKRQTLRKSHENPVVKELYAEYLGEPGSHLAHHILHTTYVKRGLYKYCLLYTSWRP